MARRDTGRAIHATRDLQRFATLVALLGVYLTLSVPHSGWAATLTDVRIGKHQQFTRVVLELDALAGYQVFEPDSVGDATIELHLDASAAPREVSAQDGLVRRVEVEPAGSKTVVRVALGRPELLINEMILLAPPRIVFDLRDPSAASTAPAQRPSSQKIDQSATPAASEPARVAAEPPSAPAPIRVVETEEPPAAVTGETKEPPAEPVRVAQKTPAAGVTQRPVQTAAPAKSLEQEQPAPRTLAADESAAAPDPTGTDVPGALGGRPAPIAASEGSSAVLRPGAVEPKAGRAWDPSLSTDGPETPPLPIPDSVRPAPPNGSAAVRPPASPPQAEASGLGGILSLVQGNLLYVGAGALVLVLLLVVVIRRRGEGDDALSPVMAADDLGGQDMLFDDPESVTEPVPAMRGGNAPPRPSNGSGVPSPATPVSGGIEDRVASLETTLQQLIKAREQIERQLAAQTEELRVQRAAIARTQRAVRAGGSGEEESGATEPVPRPPAN